MSRNQTFVATARLLYMFAGTLFIISAFFLIRKNPFSLVEALQAVIGASNLVIAISLFYDHNLKIGPERETFRAVSLLIGAILGSVAALITLTSRAFHA